MDSSRDDSWLDDLLDIDEFKRSGGEGGSFYCISCKRALREIQANEHAELKHKTLRLMKVSRKLPLKVEQLRSVIGKRFLLCHMDRIQQYIINSQNVFYLHERGAGGTSLSAGSRSVCLRCQRQLMDSANKVCYCSIECAWRARDVQIRCAFREREVSQDCAGQTLEMKCNEQQHQHTRKRPRKNAMPQRSSLGNMFD
ncbi:hypothetical protein KP509_1Z213700 [Ceratopteris richardii]|nr:hypothetical protein KP509_1Z213700 [Ceratopteris richardii]